MPLLCSPQCILEIYSEGMSQSQRPQKDLACVVTQPVRLLCATPGSVQAVEGLLLRIERAFLGCGLNKAQPGLSCSV